MCLFGINYTNTNTSILDICEVSQVYVNIIKEIIVTILKRNYLNLKSLNIKMLILPNKKF